ncbi:GntR family transcriptional regulator [Tessaracoccus antarcticus]|uniref:GntR family transcriptional regulator n=1 Tax=Tessaracoccus antarcticus TaxID=2479848 RepID=UPI0013146BE7|nr:GntR family transcriptional regulator [Tessaracoccus antarcticus]
MAVSPSGARDALRPGDVQMSLVDVSKDYIRARITAGEFPPGFRLKERELSAELGISRIPIREAVRDLSTEGFVTLLPRRGAVVSELVPEDLDDIFEVRMALEVTECGLAAQRASGEEISRMLGHVSAANDAVARGDRDAVNAANGDFHDVLVEMGHNPVLAQVLEPLRNRIQWLLRQNRDVGAICREHEEIAEAIADRDVERARRLAAVHVETSRRVATEVLFGQQEESSA